jgi:hypothetical protein
LASSPPICHSPSGRALLSSLPFITRGTACIPLPQVLNTKIHLPS